MRIQGGKNPLDATSVHPESYKAAEALLKQLGHDPKGDRGGRHPQYPQGDRGYGKAGKRAFDRRADLTRYRERVGKTGARPA